MYRKVDCIDFGQRKQCSFHVLKWKNKSAGSIFYQKEGKSGAEMVYPAPEPLGMIRVKAPVWSFMTTRERILKGWNRLIDIHLENSS